MRISTTTLESYRLFRDPEQEWMTEDAMLATIRGEFRPTRQVDIGQAFGAVLEHPEKYEIPGGYIVPMRDRENVRIALGDEVIRPALALVQPDTVFEAKAIGKYGRHEVVAKADQMCGMCLKETKTTFGTFDFDKYAASCQWRFMADIFCPLSITYHVFELVEDDRTGVIRLKGEPHTFNLYPYAGLHDDCAALVEEFAAYVRAKDLTHLLDERQLQSAGALV